MRFRSSVLSPARALVCLPALLALLSVVSVVACSNNVDSNPAKIIDLTNPQALSAVNGTNVPFGELFSVYDGGLVKSDSQVYSTGSMTFNSDGTFRLTFTVRNKLFVGTQVSSDLTATTVWTGIWSVSGTTVTYSFNDGTTTKTLTGLAGDGTSTIDVPSTVQSTATQSTVVTHTLRFAVQ